MNENDNIAHVMLRSIEEIAATKQPEQEPINIDKQIKKYKMALLFLLDKIIEDKLNLKTSLSANGGFLTEQCRLATGSINNKIDKFKELRHFIKNAGNECFIDSYKGPDDPSCVVESINTSLGNVEVVDYYYARDEEHDDQENENLSLLLGSFISYFKDDHNNAILSKVAYKCCELGTNPDSVIKLLEESCPDIFNEVNKCSD